MQERYSSFESGIGAKIAKGEATLEDCEVSEALESWKLNPASVVDCLGVGYPDV